MRPSQCSVFLTATPHTSIDLAGSGNISSSLRCTSCQRLLSASVKRIIKSTPFFLKNAQAFFACLRVMVVLLPTTAGAGINSAWHFNRAFKPFKKPKLFASWQMTPIFSINPTTPWRTVQPESSGPVLRFRALPAEAKQALFFYLA